MMPHLGVLTEVHPEAAREVFEKDCLIHLGTCIAPVGTGKEGQRAVRVTVTRGDGQKLEAAGTVGDITQVQLEVGETARAVVRPEKGFDVGAGPGREYETTVHGGLSGVIIDCRGRPLALPDSDKRRIESLTKWATQLGAYPA
jgi:hypothetical protein